MSLLETIQCATCGISLHPAFTVLIPDGPGRLRRVCLLCKEAWLEARYAIPAEGEDAPSC